MDDKNSLVKVKKGIVEKSIKRYYEIKHIPNVQKYLCKNGINCPNIYSYRIIDSYNIEYQYSYVLGENVSLCNKKFLNKMHSLIKKIENINGTNICHLKYYDKLEFYIKNVNYSNLDDSVNAELKCFFKKFKHLKNKYDCNTLIHGDLDLSNIIISPNNDLVLIDFDECCLAPLGMDWTIFLIRIWSSIENNGSIIFEDINYLIDEIKKLDLYLIELYIFKIITEKIYLIQKGIINPEDVNQKKDSYRKWINKLNILCNIVKEL